jgi:hypothetical protein
MGREGGDQTKYCKTQKEYEDFLEQEHNKSKRAKRKKILPYVEPNKAAAKKVAEEVASNMEKNLYDNYNVAVVVPFSVASGAEVDSQVEPEIVAVENAFDAVASHAHHPDSGFVQCRSCQSSLSVSHLKKDSPGICPLCDSPRTDHFVVPQHDSRYKKTYKLLAKIGKRDRAAKSPHRHLLSNFRPRPLYPKDFDVAQQRLKASILALVDKRELIKANRPKGDTHFLVRVSWLSSHDEWQDNSDMDEF